MDLPSVKLIEAARGLLQSAGYHVEHLWHVDDVHFIGEQLELEKIDDTEVREVFAIATQQFDGDTGLSWPQLEKALHLYHQRRKAVKALCPPEQALEQQP
jgi:hypothetical protein